VPKDDAIWEKIAELEAPPTPIPATPTPSPTPTPGPGLDELLSTPLAHYQNARLEEAAAAAERERLARELHDAVTQSLFSVAAIAEALPRVWEREPEEARRGLEDLRWLTQGALAEMRAMLVELRPAALTEDKLGLLLRQLTDAMMSRTRMPVTTTIVGDCPLPADVQVALYRIAQEALNNITKHARASQAKLGLHCDPGQVRLCISDDGVGFDLESARADQFGLEIMRERAQAIGASLTIDSQPGQGTRLEVDWRNG
jgi:two-component system nitrate/nitrite sensor histidine kinase NarX